MFTFVKLMPHSERSFKYNLAFPLALSIVKIAEENGGRIYASGLYFASQAEKVYRDRFKLIKEFKKDVDPDDIMLNMDFSSLIPPAIAIMILCLILSIKVKK